MVFPRREKKSCKRFALGVFCFGCNVVSSACMLCHMDALIVQRYASYLHM